MTSLRCALRPLRPGSIRPAAPWHDQVELQFRCLRITSPTQQRAYSEFTTKDDIERIMAASNDYTPAILRSRASDRPQLMPNDFSNNGFEREPSEPFAGKSPFPTHIRTLPASPSYFTREPIFNDAFIKLHALHRKFGKLPQAPPDKLERMSWRTLREYSQMVGEKIRASQYNKAIELAKHLNKIHPGLKPQSVSEAILEFKREITIVENNSKPIPIDRFGRALGVGRRKTSTARAWVVEGTGEVQINGKSLAEAFGRVHDRESALWALKVSERLDKYNVWALVEGGGTTGQAEALTLAVAKALVAHEPALKTSLRRGMFSVCLQPPALAIAQQLL